MTDERPDPIFPKGIIFKLPREGAPEFIKGSLSFKVDEACDFLRAHENNGWVNVDIKKSREGKVYLQLNTWNKESLAARLEREKKESVDAAGLINTPSDNPF